MADPDMLTRYGSGYTAAADKSAPGTGTAAITVPGTWGPSTSTNTNTGISARPLAARSRSDMTRHTSSSSSAVDPSTTRRSQPPTSAPRPRLPSFGVGAGQAHAPSSGGVEESPMPMQRTRSQKRTSRPSTGAGEGPTGVLGAGGSISRSRSGSEGTTAVSRLLSIGPGSGSGSGSTRRAQHPGKIALDIPASAKPGPRTAPTPDERSANNVGRPSFSSSLHPDTAPARKSSVEGAKGGYFFDADGYYPNHTYTRARAATHTATGTASPRRPPSVPLLDRADDGTTQMSRSRAQSSAHRPTQSDNILMGFSNVPSSSRHTSPPPPPARAQATAQEVEFQSQLPHSHSRSHTQDAFQDQYQDTLPALIPGDRDSTASASGPPSSLGTQFSSSAAHGHVLYPTSASTLHPYATATSPVASPRRAPVALPRRDSGSGSYIGHHRQQGSGSSMSQMSGMSQKALGKRPSGLGLRRSSLSQSQQWQGQGQGHTRDTSGSSAMSSQQVHAQPPVRTHSVLKKRPPRTASLHSHAHTHSHSRGPSNVSSSAYSQGSHGSGMGCGASSAQGHAYGRGDARSTTAGSNTLRVPSSPSASHLPAPGHGPGQTQTQLRSSISAPNLGEANRAFLVPPPPPHPGASGGADGDGGRRKSKHSAASGLPKGLDRWLSAETWCDAIFLPRPRFRLKSSMSTEGMRERAAGGDGAVGAGAGGGAGGQMGYGEGWGQGQEGREGDGDGRRSRKTSQTQTPQRIVSPPTTPVKGWNPPMPTVASGGTASLGRTRSASAGAASALGLGPPPGSSSSYHTPQRTVSQETQAQVHPPSSSSTSHRTTPSSSSRPRGFTLGLMKSRSAADLGSSSSTNASTTSVHKYLSAAGPGAGRHTVPARPPLSPIASVKEHSGRGSSVLLQAIFNEPTAPSSPGGEGGGGRGEEQGGGVDDVERGGEGQEEMALPVVVPTLDQVIEEGEELERQRQKWQKQARSSLGNKHTRSISRARAKSLSEAQAKRQGLVDRDQDGKKHNKHFDFLAQRTFLGTQLNAPNVTVTAPQGTSAKSLIRTRSRGTAGTGTAHTRSQTTTTGTSDTGTGTLPSSHGHTLSHATTSAGSHHHSHSHATTSTSAGHSHSHSQSQSIAHSSPSSKRGSWPKNALLKASALCTGPEQDEAFRSPVLENGEPLDIAVREGAGAGVDVGDGWVDIGRSDAQPHHHRLEPRSPTLARSRSLSQPLPNGNANALSVADPSPDPSMRGSAIGIALSTPPPSDDGHTATGREPFKFASHPYAIVTNGHPHGAPPVNHHGLSDETPKGHSAKRSEYVGPHPSAYAAQISPESATSDVSMRHRLPPGAVQQQRTYTHPFASALPCPGTAAGVNYGASATDSVFPGIHAPGSPVSLSNLDLDRMGVGAMLAYAERERASPLPTPPLPPSHPLMQRMQAQMQYHAHVQPQVQAQSHARTFTQGAELPNPYDGSDRMQRYRVEGVEEEEYEELSPKEGRFLENFSADGHVPSSDGHGYGTSSDGHSQPFQVDQAMPVFAQVQPLVPRHPHPTSGSAPWTGAGSATGYSSNRGSVIHPAIPLERQSSAQKVITMLENNDDLDEFRDLFYNPPSVSIVPAPSRSSFELQNPPQPRVHLPGPAHPFKTVAMPAAHAAEAAQWQTRTHRRKLSEVAEAESIGSSSSALTNLVHKLSAEMLSLRGDDSPKGRNSSSPRNEGSPSSLRLRHNASQERLSEKNFVFTDLTASYSALPVVLGGTSTLPLHDVVAGEHGELAGGDGGVPEDVASSRASSPIEGPADLENDTFGYPVRHQQFKPPSPVTVQNVPSQSSTQFSILVGSADEDPPHTPEREASNSPMKSSAIAMCGTGPRRPKQSAMDSALRVSCATVMSDSSRFSGLSDFPAPPHQAELTPAHMSILQGYFDSTPSATTKQVGDPLAQALGRMTRPGLSRAATSDGLLSPRPALSRSETAENAALAPSLASTHPTTEAPRPAL
ncbi:hypothetical protein CONPUDRAFT_107970 [Coniophora puteana RWD-64-598 SS2]|uniref:Uncharacterized protein n=1 Tax=Coniophora puteana (strain RWD-64-598) TaxID=741705 RepID=A0A5M3MHD7_CONPW|nr:uncharacterized protein CONPUDRAFT_107970 [Coniophora puteana RWD-64-598 SS2]EIW78194.1 hypothetical protein CONPUDRAFT_107970 [Coniophora puteana RWD-64-598 SS2]